MRLLRNGELVAEGKAVREPGGTVVLFEVKTWHVRDPDTDAWLSPREATWTVEAVGSRTDYAGMEVRIACYRDQVRSLAIDARDPLGVAVSLDVR